VKISWLKIVTILDLSADLLDYPDERYTDKLQQLQTMVAGENCMSKGIAREDMEAEYVRLFSIEATKSRTVPYASWWLDGVYHGASLRHITAFYAACGYEMDASLCKSGDHLVQMLHFLAQLIEDESYEEAKAFSRFLTWLNDFEKSLESTSTLCPFLVAVKSAIDAIGEISSYHDFQV